MLARVLVAAFLLPAVTAWAGPDSDPAASFQLEVSWGRVTTGVLFGEGELAPQLTEAPPIAPGQPRPDMDVTHVLRFQPRVVEHAPYEPGIRMNDNVATAVIAAGGAAILTSIIVDWLRK